MLMMIPLHFYLYSKNSQRRLSHNTWASFDQTLIDKSYVADGTLLFWNYVNCGQHSLLQEQSRKAHLKYISLNSHDKQQQL